MTSKRSHPIRQTVVISDRASCVAISTEVLPGIKRKRRDVPKCSNQLPLVLGHVRLRAIFNHPKFMLPGDGHDRFHVGRLTVKMNWNDTDSGRCDLLLDQRRVDRESVVVGIAEDYPASSLS